MVRRLIALTAASVCTFALPASASPQEAQTESELAAARAEAEGALEAAELAAEAEAIAAEAAVDSEEVAAEAAALAAEAEALAKEAAQAYPQFFPVAGSPHRLVIKLTDDGGFDVSGDGVPEERLEKIREQLASGTVNLREGVTIELGEDGHTVVVNGGPFAGAMAFPAPGAGPQLFQGVPGKEFKLERRHLKEFYKRAPGADVDSFYFQNTPGKMDPKLREHLRELKMYEHGEAPRVFTPQQLEELKQLGELKGLAELKELGELKELYKLAPGEEPGIFLHREGKSFALPQEWKELRGFDSEAFPFKALGRIHELSPEKRTELHEKITALVEEYLSQHAEDDEDTSDESED